MNTNVKLVPFGIPCNFEVKCSLLKNENKIELQYNVVGPISSLSFENFNQQQFRPDEIWKRSCFELFLKDPSSTRYYEFNFSPQGAWNSYYFNNYRELAGHSLINKEPIISFEKSINQVSCFVELNLSNWISKRFTLASTTCILKNQDNHNNYFAPSHPCDDPDFHHYDGFTINLGE